MSYRYIALVQNDPLRDNDSIAPSEAALDEMGMMLCMDSRPVRLFVSRNTPTLAIADGGVIIGHVFENYRSRSARKVAFPTFSCTAQARKHLLENCWGEYLLFQPETIGPQRFSVTRDPSGGVCCVYSLRSGSGFVTSDISLAFSLGLYRSKIDWEFVSDCLEFPHLKAERTGLADVCELLPGCSLHVATGDPFIEQCWSPWDFVDGRVRHSDYEDAAADVRAAVTSVTSAWAEADRSILVELSGGLDSSIVAASLRGAQERVTCCNLVTPVPGGDERQYAQLVADGLGVELRVKEMGLENVLINFPIPSSSITPRVGLLQHISNELKESIADRLGVDSFYTGGGGDSVFAYLKTAAPAADAIKERGLAAGAAATRDLSELHQCTFWKAGRLTLKKLASPSKLPCKADRSFLARSKPAGTSPNHPWFNAVDKALPGDRERIFDLVGTQVFRDATPRAQRRKLRMPLLSQPVVEACLRVPSWMWIHGGQNRAVARSAFAEMLPPEIVNRRSKGSLIGYLGVVYKKNKEQIQSFLLSGHLRERQLLDAEALRDFFARDLPTRDQSFLRILDLCTIENWVRHRS